ncbi:YhgE/Pip domain-containing protein [Streptomyces sp. NPDC086010]|uniref:YhgE/Pip domain-containing protein n=1 Tax=Streptomyces sp. NPDC086010 TaxID=3365745 RepID=UPI0037CDFFB1
MNVAEPGAQPPLVRATAMVRHGKIWLVPTITSALVALCLTLLYVGGILNPNGNLHHLPVALVDNDQGPPLPGQQQPLGAQLSRSIVAATPADTVRWRRLSQAGMQDQLASGKIYGALVIPPDFTASVRALTTPGATARPVLAILTNPGLGSFGSSLASQITQGAAHQASLSIGRQLTTRTPAEGATTTARALLSDPVTVTTRVGHPIGRHSGLGLTAFYYTLLLVLTAFVGGNIINSGVDAALGYTDSEIGPWYTRHPTVPISRKQTLLLKMFLTAGITVLTTSLLMIAAIAILGMDATHIPLLWIFSYCASLAVGLGVQAINAAFGGIGQVVSMFVFVALSLPSSGATIPLEAVPDFYRFLSLFEPMRQLSDGVRAILYFDARSDAGLTRGWTMIAIGIAFALLFGFGMTRYYDRKGLHRAAPQPLTTPRR